MLQKRVARSWSVFDRSIRTRLLCVALGFVALPCMQGADVELSVEQVTSGTTHHFFGYIGQCQTIPWNGTRQMFMIRIRSRQ